MPLPNFTDTELYLINFTKSPSSTGQSSYMWGYLIGGAVLMGFGAYHDSVPMMLTAFIVVLGFRIYEEIYQSKWLPVWRSIIEKSEAAAIGESDGDESGGKES